MSQTQVSSTAASVENVIRAVIHDVPPAPAFVALARFMYDPGAFFPTAAGAGPVVVRLEAGTLSFHTEKPVFLTRGGPPAGPETIPAGGSFDVGIGDQIYVPGDTPHSATNRATLSAVSGGLAIFRGAPAQEFPPGLTFHPLVIGQALSLPPGSALETVDRLTFGAGAREPSRTEGGLGLYYVEQGKLGLGVEQGQVVVNRRVKVISGQPPGPPPPPEPVQPGSQTTLDIGEGAVAQTGAVVTTWNAGDGSAVVLRALVEPAAAGGPGGGGGGGRGPRDAVLAYFYDVWDSGNLGLVDELFAPDFTNNNLLAGQQPGVAGVRQFVTRFRRAFPDCAVSVDLQLSESDRVVTRYTVRGTHRDAFQGIAATGRPIQVSGIAIHRVAGGRIAEAWGYWDQASLLVQLGAFQFPNVGQA